MDYLNKYDLKIQLSQTKIRFVIIANPHQFVRFRCNTRIKNVFLNKQSTRHSKCHIKRAIKFKEINEYISRIVDERWNISIPITMDILKRNVVSHVIIKNEL